MFIQNINPIVITQSSSWSFPEWMFECLIQWSTNCIQLLPCNPSWGCERIMNNHANYAPMVFYFRNWIHRHNQHHHHDYDHDHDHHHQVGYQSFPPLPKHVAHLATQKATRFASPPEKRLGKWKSWRGTARLMVDQGPCSAGMSRLVTVPWWDVP